MYRTELLPPANLRYHCRFYAYPEPGFMDNRKIAFVTGASRGIGKASAIALAENGFDVAISARTVKEGDSHHDIPLPGSLESTADAIRALGREALPIPMDLLQLDSVLGALDTVIELWGHIDVLVNNAVYQGPGTLDRVLDLSIENLEQLYRGNLFNQIALIQRALKVMLARNSGRIINLVSETGMKDPARPVDDGGWSFAYSSSKAAFQRLPGVLRVELPDNDIQVFSVEPGFIITESMKARGMDEEFSSQWGGAPPSVPAAVIAWLASSEEAKELHGELVLAQRVALKRQLHPDWRPPKN